jgi:hypothetical protein
MGKGVCPILCVCPVKIAALTGRHRREKKEKKEKRKAREKKRISHT